MTQATFESLSAPSSLNAQDLCTALLHADTEEQVIDLLGECGLWDNPDAWRYFGDKDSNYQVIGNQQSRADGAIVEKIVNSVDALLMRECQRLGIHPESEDAPVSLPQAIDKFFGSPEGESLITLSATGSRRKPCFTIVDLGEGQAPPRMSDTLLSLDRKNKDRVPFVQGKFNMGGTGALEFCGKRNLQLIISRRDPAVLAAMNEDHADGDKWSFTIVRRDDPGEKEKNSVYTYLAPLNVTEARKGQVLHFSADSLPLRPRQNQPYEVAAKWGTAIKLYEYEALGFRSNILMRDGLLSKLDLLLPDLPLSVRLHECRDFKGHAGSFATSVRGLLSRLGSERQTNLEEGFPSSAGLHVEGESGSEQLSARIFAFLPDRAQTYRNNEGIIFSINGR